MKLRFVWLNQWVLISHWSVFCLYLWKNWLYRKSNWCKICWSLGLSSILANIAIRMCSLKLMSRISFLWGIRGRILGWFLRRLILDVIKKCLGVLGMWGLRLFGPHKNNIITLFNTKKKFNINWKQKFCSHTYKLVVYHHTSRKVKLYWFVIKSSLLMIVTRVRV